MTASRWSLPAIPTIALRRDLACGIVALLLGLLAVWVSVDGFGGRLSTLVRMTKGDPIAQIASTDPDFVYVQSHYDGIYFYAMALDPFATGRPHTLIDLAADRYGHPAYGWTAGLLSLFGPRVVPLALVLTSLASLFAAGFFASRLSSLLGWSGWGGLAIAFNPGLIFAAANDTSEAFGAALLAATLWLWVCGYRRLACLTIIPLCFAKEHLLLVPVGLAAWEVVSVLRGGSAAIFVRRLAFLLPGPLLYVVWAVYVHGVFGRWPYEQGNNLALPIPLVGWIQTMQMAAGMAASGFSTMQLGEGTLPLQVVALAAILLGMLRAARLRSPIDPIYLLLGVLMCYLSWPHILYPKDLIRDLAFAFVLLPAVVPDPPCWSSSRSGQQPAGNARESVVADQRA